MTSIPNETFAAAAKKLQCKISDIRAVDEVESGGVGMQKGTDGIMKPIILFEPHVLWRQLKKMGLDPNQYTKEYGDMLYPIWNTKPYPTGQTAQWIRFDRACKINREAAIKACSWGRYQVLGENYRMTGSTDPQNFVNRMFKGDLEHLMMFVSYIIKAGLQDELAAEDWKQFASGYNGAYYFRNKYDTKLAAAKKKWISSDV